MATFEDQMAELETVVERLERGDLGLEESVRLFEEGMRLTSACRKELDAAEGRLQVLTEQPNGKLAPVDLSLEDAEFSAAPDEDDAEPFQAGERR